MVQLDKVFYSPDVDFFRCEDCRFLWHVDKGTDGPPSRTLLGQSDTDVPHKTPKSAGTTSTLKVDQATLSVGVPTIAKLRPGKAKTATP